MNFGAAYQVIIERLRYQPDMNLIYHDFGHTMDVYQFAGLLAETEGLTEQERRLVETAALLHDAGMPGHYNDHEIWSARLAGDMLAPFGYTSEEIDLIRELILQTSLPQEPKTLMSRILCDADLNYLGRNDFFINSFKLKLEWQLTSSRYFSLYSWMQLQTLFMHQHRFFTEGAIRLRAEGKEHNINLVNQIIAKIEHQ